MVGAGNVRRGVKSFRYGEGGSKPLDNKKCQDRPLPELQGWGDGWKYLLNLRLRSDSCPKPKCLTLES